MFLILQTQIFLLLQTKIKDKFFRDKSIYKGEKQGGTHVAKTYKLG